LQKKHGIFLYINKSLYENAINNKIADLSKENCIIINDPIVPGIKSKLFLISLIPYFYKELKGFRSIHLVSGGAHFSGIFKLFKLFSWKPKTIATYANPSLTHASYRSKFKYLLWYITLKTCDQIDSLNYTNDLNKYRKKGSYTISPCSFSKPDLFTFKGNYLKDKEDAISFVATFHSQKQPLLFINAIPLIDKKNKNLKYYVIGNGEQENIIKEKINQFPKELKNKITFKHLSNPAEIIKKSKIFLSLQYLENYPSQSLQEALHAQNYIIATDVGDTRRMLKDDFTFFVKNNSPEEIATGVVNFFKLSPKKQEESSRKGKEFIAKNFTIDIFAAYFLKIHQLV